VELGGFMDLGLLNELVGTYVGFIATGIVCIMTGVL